MRVRDSGCSFSKSVLYVRVFGLDYDRFARSRRPKSARRRAKGEGQHRIDSQNRCGW